MLLAYDHNGKRVSATKGGAGMCPGCHTRVIAKCGQIKVHHWAHENLHDCDSWSEGETEWHIAWKERFPVTWREVVVGTHRADVRTQTGVVIEFQHSPISPEEIAKREAFYQRMVWVFDAHDFKDRIKVANCCGTVMFSWKSPRLSHLVINKPLYWDFGDKLLHVQKCTREGGHGEWVSYSDFMAFPGERGDLGSILGSMRRHPRQYLPTAVSKFFSSVYLKTLLLSDDPSYLSREWLAFVKRPISLFGNPPRTPCSLILEDKVHRMQEGLGAVRVVDYRKLREIICEPWCSKWFSEFDRLAEHEGSQITVLGSKDLT